MTYREANLNDWFALKKCLTCRHYLASKREMSRLVSLTRCSQTSKEPIFFSKKIFKFLILGSSVELPSDLYYFFFSLTDSLTDFWLLEKSHFENSSVMGLADKIL